MKLAVLKGFQDKNDVTISGVPYAIGRCRSADFVIAHVNVSRNHCKIIKENEWWKISDFSSSGTYVNDTLIGKGKTVILNNGDSVRFGPLENNLRWTFYSFDSPSDYSNCSDAKSKTQAVLSLYNEEGCLKGKNVSDEKTHLDLNYEEHNASQGTKNYYGKNTSETNLTVHKQGTRVNNLKVMNESPNFINYSHSAEEEILKGKRANEKIQELTKELQEVQSALNYLEEKNSALQVKLAAGINSRSEMSHTTNLLENLADVMEAEFQCTICSELFVTAITLSCTHTFCKFCIGQWKKKQKTCPICRKKITSETRSLVVDNYIDKVVGNLSLELKERREAIIMERNESKPCKKRIKSKH